MCSASIGPGSSVSIGSSTARTPGVFAGPHLLGDGLHGQQALNGAVAIDDDSGLDVGVEHHR